MACRGPCQPPQDAVQPATATRTHSISTTESQGQQPLRGGGEGEGEGEEVGGANASASARARAGSRARAVFKDSDLVHWILPSPWQCGSGRWGSLGRAIVVMSWHCRGLNLPAIVLPIKHAISWLVSRKISKETQSQLHVLAD